MLSVLSLFCYFCDMLNTLPLLLPVSLCLFDLSLVILLFSVLSQVVKNRVFWSISSLVNCRLDSCKQGARTCAPFHLIYSWFLPLEWTRNDQHAIKPLTDVHLTPSWARLVNGWECNQISMGITPLIVGCGISGWFLKLDLSPNLYATRSSTSFLDVLVLGPGSQRTWIQYFYCLASTICQHKRTGRWGLSAVWTWSHGMLALWTVGYLVE